MTKMALRSAGQTVTKRRNRGGAAGPLTRMAHDQPPLGAGRRAAGGGTQAHEDAASTADQGIQAVPGPGRSLFVRTGSRVRALAVRVDGG